MTPELYGKGPDRVLLVLCLALTGFGALMIYSSTSVTPPGTDGADANQFYYFKRHLITVVAGVVAMWAAYRVRPERLGSCSVPVLLISLGLLLMVFTPLGVSAGGARRWLKLWPSTFQPSELVKLSMVVFLAWYVSRPYFKKKSLFMFLIPVFVMGGFQVVFLKQPDFGAAMSLGVLTVAMLFLSGVRLRYLISLVLMSVPAVVYLIYNEPYRWKRITSFVNPWSDPRGSGFQLIQSYIALGSGGLTGVGLGQSKQKLSYLPEVHTDFIFSIVGEELGFAVASLVVVLFAMIFWRGLRIARRTGEEFHYYLAFGLSMMVALQALVNFSVTTGLLPTKGLPLPFISYGGSALLVNMVAVGIILSISRGVRASEKTPDRLKEVIRRKKAKRAVYGSYK